MRQEEREFYLRVYEREIPDSVEDMHERVASRMRRMAGGNRIMSPDCMALISVMAERSVATSHTSSEPPVVKRKRGRPRKYETETVP